MVTELILRAIQMKITYIAMVNVPSPRAQSVHIMKMAEALDRLGKLQALILPGMGVDLKKVYQYYDISEIPIVLLPCLDILTFVYSRGVRNAPLLGLLFRIKHITFTISSFVYMLFKRRRILWTREPLLTVVGKKLGYKTVFDVHGLSSFPRATIGLALRSADLCVALTSSLENVIRSHNEHVLVAGDCVDLKEMDNAQPIDLGGGQHVMYVGWLSKEKGVYDLLKAWKRVMNEDRHLWFVGGGGIQDLKNFADKEGLRNVHFVGALPHSEAIRYLKSSTINVIPTRKSPFFRYSSPMKLFEAAASKKPIIASNIEGNKEFVKDGVSGLLFKEGNPKNLAKKMNRLLENKELRRKVAIIAYEEVKEYTWKNRVQKVLEKDIIRERR